MKNAKTKLITFLSDPNLSDSDFRELARFISSGEVRRCVHAAEHLRRVRHQVFRDFSPELDSELYQRVKSLLIDEAHMSTRHAIHALASEIGFHEEYSPRWTLQRALQHFTEATDGSTILSAAQKIYNKLKDPANKHEWSFGRKSDHDDPV